MNIYTYLYIYIPKSQLAIPFVIQRACSAGFYENFTNELTNYSSL